jgi:hypothetical protein
VKKHFESSIALKHLFACESPFFTMEMLRNKKGRWGKKDSGGEKEGMFFFIASLASS